MFGFDQRNHSDQDLADLTKKLTQIDIDLESERQKNRDTAS